jgi:hypothetical protein
MQRTQTFTGIQVIRTQDTAMTESMGGIVDRSEEHLGTTDAAVIAARRRLLQMARDLQNGIEPSAALQPESYSIQEKDFPNTKVKQPGPIRLAGCRARVFLPVYE